MDIERFSVRPENRIVDVLKKIDKNGKGMAIVVSRDSNKALGIVTDGDIRRYLLRGGLISKRIDSVMNQEFISLEKRDADEDRIRQLFQMHEVRAIPILGNGRLVDIVLDIDFLLKDTSHNIGVALNIPLVVMAGGKGVRLGPFTNVLPKPLLPINGVPTIERIIERFCRYSPSKILISINEKAEMVKAYFNGKHRSQQLSFIEEKEPLGTVGSLSLARRQLKGDFFLSNCDVIIEYDYAEILSFHRQQGFAMTIVGARRKFVVPYGVCHVNGNGRLEGMVEKPSQDVIINAGCYVLNSRILDLIPKNQWFDLPDLIRTIRDQKDEVGVFSVPEDKYLDVGQWDEYRRTVEHFGTLGI